MTMANSGLKGLMSQMRLVHTEGGGGDALMNMDGGGGGVLRISGGYY